MYFLERTILSNAWYSRTWPEIPKLRSTEFNYNLFWGVPLKGCEIIGKVSWNVHKSLASSCVRFKQILKSYFGHISNYGFVWCYFTTNISRSCVLTVVMCELEKEDFWNQMTFLLSWAHFRSSGAVIHNFLYKVYIGQLFSQIFWDEIVISYSMTYKGDYQ